MRSIARTLGVSRGAVARADGNSVSMEEELGRMRENRIMYELYTSILRGQMNLIRSAIHGDR